MPGRESGEGAAFGCGTRHQTLSPQAVIPFVKTEALGNDFILVREGDASGFEYPELARNMCDRRRGVGADGLILWNAPGKEDTYRLRIFNIDGSEAECSGNGLRCLAAYLFGRPHTSGEVRLQTVSGVYLLARSGRRYVADMGVPALDPTAIPFSGEGAGDRIVDYRIDVDDETLRITACATGNPHCSLFVSELDDAMIERLGPRLERHGSFPKRTNVEFIHVLNRNEIEVAFWERGAGRTPASGTGSCGATVACVLNGHTERRITVHTENGDLQVEWRENEHLHLEADASVVAEGRYLL